MYVILDEDGYFTTPPGAYRERTKDLREARIFATRDLAIKAGVVPGECVVPVTDLLTVEGVAPRLHLEENDDGIWLHLVNVPGGLQCAVLVWSSDEPHNCIKKRAMKEIMESQPK